MLFPHMTVRKNIEFGLRMRDQARSDWKAEVDAAIDLFQLQALEDRMPTKLSGGEKQKVALARVLVLEPKLILLDEPLGSIDADARRELRSELKKIHSKGQVATIHVTHDQMEGFSLAQRMAIMRDGQIAQTGDPEEIFNNPKDKSIARLLGYENIYEAKLVKTGRNTSFLNVNGLTLEIEGTVESNSLAVGIRASDLTVSLKPSPLENSNTVRGRILGCDDMGSMIILDIDVGFPIKATLSKREYMTMRIDLSPEIWVSFAPGSVKILE
jgi:ABC-type Fe3+/spermidine/putrescine transport system ATPase subunit